MKQVLCRGAGYNYFSPQIYNLGKTRGLEVRTSQEQEEVNGEKNLFGFLVRRGSSRGESACDISRRSVDAGGHDLLLTLLGTKTSVSYSPSETAAPHSLHVIGACVSHWRQMGASFAQSTRPRCVCVTLETDGCLFHSLDRFFKGRSLRKTDSVLVYFKIPGSCYGRACQNQTTTNWSTLFLEMLKFPALFRVGTFLLFRRREIELRKSDVWVVCTTYHNSSGF